MTLVLRTIEIKRVGLRVLAQIQRKWGKILRGASNSLPLTA